MLPLGRERVSGLRARGLADAVLYDPPGVGGTHQIFVIPFGEQLADYGLPSDPQTSSEVFSLLSGVASLSAGLAGFGLLGAVARLLMAPEETAPEDSVPEETLLVETAPGKAAPGDGVIRGGR
jgi:formate dehydrogenase iron-sulfur subunit